MKSESGESLKRLQAELGSAEVYDFLYVDRARISALYAQLFPQGILTTVRTTSQQSFSDDSNIGTDVKVFKAEAKSVESGMEGIEHMFDASWSIPLEVLARLKSRSLVRECLRGAGLGSIVLTDCLLRVVEFTSMDDLWEPALKFAYGAGEPHQQIVPELIPTLIGALKAMPHAIHAHFLTKEGFLWSSLQPASLTVKAK